MFIENQPEFLRSVKSDEVLPEISNWTKLTGILLLSTCGLVILLSSIIEYSTTVKAQGKVRPAGELRIVEAATSGVVNAILVEENQVVQSGQPIATIENSQLLTRRSQVLLSIEQQNSELNQIDAQLKALEAQFLAEYKGMTRAIASAEGELRRLEREHSDRQIITQAQAQEGLASVEFAREELRRYRQLGGTGAISQLQIKEKEQAYKAAQARLIRARAELNPSISPVEIAQENIARQSAAGESVLAALERERENMKQRRINIENQIRRSQQELKQINTDLQKTIIRSSTAGTVVNVELRNTGQVVRPGLTIAQIAASDAPIVIKGRIRADDISKVQVCKDVLVKNCQEGKVQLRVSAYPYPDYGTLTGAVRSITADAITPQARGNAPVEAYYEVTIEPEKLYLEKGDGQYPIQLGMEVRADIISKEETVLTFVLRKARLLTNV